MLLVAAAAGGECEGGLDATRGQAPLPFRQLPKRGRGRGPWNPRMLTRCLLTAATIATAATLLSTQTRPAVAAKDVTVLGFKLHYLEAGAGTPVVLLHGVGGDGSRWTPNIEPLAKDFHVYALDQIGFGQSDKPLANYHTGMLAEFLADFLKAIGQPKASLVGNSMGAGVALYMAVHYPTMGDRIVLADGGGFRSPNAAPPGPPTADALRRRQLQNAVTREETREFFRILFHDKSLVTPGPSIRSLLRAPPCLAESPMASEGFDQFSRSCQCDPIGFRVLRSPGRSPRQSLEAWRDRFVARHERGGSHSPGPACPEAREGTRHRQRHRSHSPGACLPTRNTKRRSSKRREP